MDSSTFIIAFLHIQVYIYGAMLDENYFSLFHINTHQWEPLFQLLIFILLLNHVYKLTYAFPYP